jgi:hypothetical protein|tara:strand:- start:15978 stop:16223 length:246 start_codon:yes stop_codon:yes gene_type:complete
MVNATLSFNVRSDVTASGQAKMECVLEKDSDGKRYFDLQFGEYPTTLHIYLPIQGLWRLQRVLKGAEIKVKEDMKDVKAFC